MPLYQIGPNRWSNRSPEQSRARSDLPLPHVISDTMPPTEQVDGKFYTSKREFRRVGKSLGLIEVGNEKPHLKKRTTPPKGERIKSIRKAIAQYREGRRV